MVEDDPLVETVVSDRYRIVRKLAEGVMSAIYEAQHVKLARTFALKVLLPQFLYNEEAVQRFEREAEMLATMRHPNVVDICDYVTMPDGRPAMVLEFLHGNSLQVRLQRAQLAWDLIARLGDQTMSALALAHRNGIVHRDLKPENLFISIDDVGEERVKLLDFGVSKLRGADRNSQQYKLLGTPSYMSPEQAQGLTHLIGPSTDVWAMGAILYEMATQKIAFQDVDLEGTLGLIIAGQKDPITRHRADAPQAFVDLIDRALSADPMRRIQTIEELRHALKFCFHQTPRLQLKTPVSGVPITPPAAQTSQPVPGAILPPTVQPAPIVTAVAPSDNKRWWVIGGVAAVVVTVVNVLIAFVL